MSEVSDIVRLSLNLFVKYGIKSVTTDGIASKLSISKKTLYHHICDKKSLVARISNHIQSIFSDKLHEITHHKLHNKDCLTHIGLYILTYTEEYHRFLLDIENYYFDLWVRYNYQQTELISKTLAPIYQKVKIYRSAKEF